MKNQLLEGEKIITQSGNELVTLTNKRIRYNSTSFGKAHLVSIMLNKISAIELHYRSHIIALLLGCLFFLAGFISGTQNEVEAMIGLTTAGIALIVFYFLTRKHVVSIISDSGKAFHFDSKGMKRDVLLKFVNQIEDAKEKDAKL